jgi:hypothetical protein
VNLKGPPESGAQPEIAADGVAEMPDVGISRASCQRSSLIDLRGVANRYGDVDTRTRREDHESAPSKTEPASRRRHI